MVLISTVIFIQHKIHQFHQVHIIKYCPRFKINHFCRINISFAKVCHISSQTNDMSNFVPNDNVQLMSNDRLITVMVDNCLFITDVGAKRLINMRRRWRCASWGFLPARDARCNDSQRFSSTVNN